MERASAGTGRLPAVLLGGLPLVRSLGMAGIPVIVASPNRRSPGMASRYCSGRLELPPLTDRAAVVDALIEAGRKLTQRHGLRPPLLYENDDLLALVQDYRSALEPHFALLLNEPRLADAMLDKAKFQDVAEACGLPVPRRIEWRALESETGAVLAKPKSKDAWDSNALHLKLFGGAGKALVFRNGLEATACAEVRRFADRLTFQEYVAGDDSAIWSFHGFATAGGELLEWFIGRKIRTYPALTGDSAYLRLAYDPQLADLGRRICERLALAGIFKMDFKRCEASGRFFVLEINARYNLWHVLGARAGVNLPRVAYDYLVYGKRSPHVEARGGFRWLSLRFDLRAYRELKAAGRISFARWLWTLAQGRKVYELFAWTDPMPFVKTWHARLRSMIGRRMHRWLARA